MNPILEATCGFLLSQEQHRNGASTGWDVFCRLVRKNLQLESLTLDSASIESIEETWDVDKLFKIHDETPENSKHHRASPSSHDKAIVVINFDGLDRIIDGGNLINYWRSNPPGKPIRVHYHRIKATL